jgi:hypothetical protein
MNKELRLLTYAFFSALMTIFVSCKKDAEIPTLTTTAVSSITITSAETGGNVTSSGGEAVTARGVCWSTAHSPTVAGSKTIDGTGSGAFTSSITGLTPNTAYYVRAYATNSVGTAYGKEISFTSNQMAIATLTTTAITDITTSSAVSGGNITFRGGLIITDWGVCWSTSENPTTDNDKRSVTGVTLGSGIFTCGLANLNQGTTYFLRAYAVNSAGTAYGNEISFSTQFTVTTSAIVSFTSTTAVVTGNVIYGQTGYQLIGSGVCWSTFHNPTTADSKTPYETYSGIFTTNLTGLTQGTTYFVRAYAEYESSPTIYGNELSFTTSFEPGTGTQKADFPGGARSNASGFSIGTKVYLGLGTSDGDNILKDFWEWDQASNVWTRKADYPGHGFFGTVGFSIGTKGYMGTGETNEFWEYDPATNDWTQKSSLPGSGSWGRIYAVGFSIGAKGYIGTGSLSLGSNSESRDFWEWDQATNIWTQKADFGGNARAGAVGFSIGNKGYIGTGSGNGTAYKDFWEWNQATNVWTQKADFAGTSRFAAVGFSIVNKGYIGTGINYGTYGYKKDFWEWDQTTNVWTQKANFAGNARSSAVGFSIGNNSYIGTGYGSDGNVLQDFWEYDPNLK